MHFTESNPAALGSLRVVDISESVAGQFCCSMLADYGAEVALVEPIAGSALRKVGPFRRQSPNESLLFHHLNLNKRSVVLDLGAAEGDLLFRNLTSAADVIVAPANFDDSVIRRQNPDCVIATVSPFGADGPKEHWRGAEIVYQAMSGMMIHNGRLDREPLYGVGQRASYCAGIAAYINIIAALMKRVRFGAVENVAIDIAHTAASMTYPFALQYSYNGSFEERGMDGHPLVEVQTKDSWISIWIRTGQFPDFCRALDAQDLLEDARFSGDSERRKNFRALVEIVQQRIRNRSSSEIVAGMQARRIVAAACFKPSQLGADAPHLKARNFWQNIPSSTGFPFALGPQFRMGRTPCRAATFPPSLPVKPTTKGQVPAWPEGRFAPPAHAASAVLPLAGLRIVELTTAWAGPMAGRILAYLGAEVIHIEPASNLDSWRSYSALIVPNRYPRLLAGERRYNRCALFNSQNVDKLSFSLDMRMPEGKEVFADLMRCSDGLITNFTPGMVERLSFGNDALRKLKPDLCFVEMPAYGNSGPMRNWTALGPTMEQVAGMCAIIGYGDGCPVSTGPAYLDPIGAFHGAAAMLTALLHKQRTGEGQDVEVPQVEAAMHLIGEHLLAAAETGENPPVNANRLTEAAPHDVFPAAGHDEWVVISVSGDGDWAVLCRLIGRPELITDSRFASAAARSQHQDELAHLIAEWTRGHDKHALARDLQNAGIAAAAVYRANDTLECEYLNHRQFSTELDHPEAGVHLHQGLPFRLSATELKHRRAAPTLGEHNEHILSQILGKSKIEIETLSRSGAIRSVPDT